MRRRKIDVENLGENTQISLKLPQKVLKWIEKACEDNPKFTGRSHFIDNACRYYLNLEPCSNCGKLNPRDANVCAYCTTELQGMQDILEEVQSYVTEYEERHSFGCEINDTATNLLIDIQDYLNALDATTRENIGLDIGGFGDRCRSKFDFGYGYFSLYREMLPTFQSINIIPCIPDSELTILNHHKLIIPHTKDLVEKYRNSKGNWLHEANVREGLYYYKMAKKVLNGDNFSLEEINNLRDGLKLSIQSTINYIEALNESYEELLIYQKMAKLLVEKNELM